MVGTAATRFLTESGHEVIRLVRHQSGKGEVWWDPEAGKIDEHALEGFDGVVHLASIPWPMRWTARAKQAIIANKVATNRLLAESLARCVKKPSVFVSASGIGAYPALGDDVITEQTCLAKGFLAEADLAGEAATGPASKAGIRVVLLRIPPVLGGSALQRAGFRAGDGRQWMSWVGLDELASIIEYALTSPALCGPVNAVSPDPMRAAD